MRSSEALRLGEWIGLALAPLVFLPQAWFLSYAALFQHAGLGGAHPFTPSVSPESVPSGRLVWELWAMGTLPVACIQALVVTPLVCLWVLRTPGKNRRTLVQLSLLLSLVTLILSVCILLLV